MTTTSPCLTLAALAIALPLGLAACGASDTGTPGSSSMSESMSKSPDTMTKTPDAMTPSATAMADAMSQVFGPGCAAVPKDGSGSFNGMATDPVATAASHNPLLSTLVTAVTTAGLGDTLNSAPAITVFAPVNDAFAKVPAADLKALLANKPALTKVLTNRRRVRQARTRAAHRQPQGPRRHDDHGDRLR